MRVRESEGEGPERGISEVLCKTHGHRLGHRVPQVVYAEASVLGHDEQVRRFQADAVQGNDPWVAQLAQDFHLEDKVR